MGQAGSGRIKTAGEKKGAEGKMTQKGENENDWKACANCHSLQRECMPQMQVNLI